MVSPPSNQPTEGRAGAWIQWLGAVLTGTLAVLFVVVLQRVQELNQSLRTLEQRLQTLENARALERTNTLEQQLRSTVERLHGLEESEGQVGELARQQRQLADQLARLESSPPPGRLDGSGQGGDRPPALLPPSARGPSSRPPAPRPAAARPATEAPAPGLDQL
ncbi:hypothetical protein [Cyanobium sp. Morenito 9A2]|uniref:hypothetical protein n=1 Tax=Cyanobium sp. Morenito 9A2 TaxID=2823718 RepID=UPI0020CF8976|nr:hypothetical protein [Cyanobium sp. Morenito 9A2]MCP9848333.1 DUF948 domain-containing protein [Cyanobium sp. Morenito 9A2]